MTSPKRTNTHRCPGCRKAEVHNSKLACVVCWAKLPKVLRDEVWATARYPLTHPRRRDALKAAMVEWDH